MDNLRKASDTDHLREKIDKSHCAEWQATVMDRLMAASIHNLIQVCNLFTLTAKARRREL